MNECKQKYIEWSSENGNYCGEYDNGRLIGTDAVNEFDGWEAAWNHQQAKIDELQRRLSKVDGLIISFGDNISVPLRNSLIDAVRGLEDL